MAVSLLMQRNGQRSLAASFCLALAAFGCTVAPATPTATPTSRPASPSPASATPTEEPPTPSPAVGAPSVSPASARPLRQGELAPGTYLSTGTGIDVTFTVRAGWQAGEDIPEVGFDVVQMGAAGPAALTVMRFHDEVFADACDPEAGTEPLDSTPAGLLEFLGARDGISPVGDPEPATVAGYDGLQLDLSVELPDECRGEPPEWLWLWPLPVVGDFHFADGEQARVIAVDVEGTLLVIVAEAYPGVDFDAFLEEAMAVVDSVEIKP